MLHIKILWSQAFTLPGIQAALIAHGLCSVSLPGGWPGTKTRGKCNTSHPDLCEAFLNVYWIAVPNNEKVNVFKCWHYTLIDPFRSHNNPRKMDAVISPISERKNEVHDHGHSWRDAGLTEQRQQDYSTWSPNDVTTPPVLQWPEPCCSSRIFLPPQALSPQHLAHSQLLSNMSDHSLFPWRSVKGFTVKLNDKFYPLCMEWGPHHLTPQFLSVSFVTVLHWLPSVSATEGHLPLPKNTVNALPPPSAPLTALL